MGLMTLGCTKLRWLPFPPRFTKPAASNSCMRSLTLRGILYRKPPSESHPYGINEHREYSALWQRSPLRLNHYRLKPVGFLRTESPLAAEAARGIPGSEPAQGLVGAVILNP